MRLKSVFILLNLTVLLLLIFIISFPFFSLGLEYAILFWSHNGYLIGLSLMALVGFDCYFFYHRQFLDLLERQDWSNLLTLLDDQLAKRKGLSLRKTHLYIHACIIQKDMLRLAVLRAVYAERKPKFLPKVAFGLGFPLLLENKAQELDDFFSPLLRLRSRDLDQLWMRWSLAFALVLKREFLRAKGLLLVLIEIKKQPVLQLLSLYLLDQLKITNPEVVQVIQPHVLNLKGHLTEKKWNLYINHLKMIFVFFLGHTLYHALVWFRNFESEQIMEN